MMKIEGIPLPSGPKVFLGNFFHVREDKPRASGKKSRNSFPLFLEGGGYYPFRIPSVDKMERLSHTLFITLRPF